MVNDNVKKIANSYIKCEKQNIQNICKVIEKISAFEFNSVLSKSKEIIYLLFMIYILFKIN